MCSNRNVQKCQVLMRKNVDMLAGVCTDTIIGWSCGDVNEENKSRKYIGKKIGFEILTGEKLKEKIIVSWNAHVSSALTHNFPC